MAKILKIKVKECWQCPKHHTGDIGVYHCLTTNKRISMKMVEKFPDWCPLEEVKGE